MLCSLTSQPRARGAADPRVGDGGRLRHRPCRRHRRRADLCPRARSPAWLSRRRAWATSSASCASTRPCASGKVGIVAAIAVHGGRRSPRCSRAIAGRARSPAAVAAVLALVAVRDRLASLEQAEEVVRSGGRRRRSSWRSRRRCRSGSVLYAVGPRERRRPRSALAGAARPPAGRGGDRPPARRPRRGSGSRRRTAPFVLAARRGRGGRHRVVRVGCAGFDRRSHPSLGRSSRRCRPSGAFPFFGGTTAHWGQFVGVVAIVDGHGVARRPSQLKPSVGRPDRPAERHSRATIPARSATRGTTLVRSSHSAGAWSSPPTGPEAVDRRRPGRAR